MKKSKSYWLIVFFLLILFRNQSSAQCVANFTFTQGPNGFVTFTSTSVGTGSFTNYNWNYGNAQGNNGIGLITTSTTYTANGNYIAMLTISNGTACNSTYTALITVSTVTGTPCNLNANFSYSQGANGLVNFFNTSTGTVVGTTYFWNFGDNTTGNTASPAHTYSANGTYIATLTANNNFSVACVSTKTLAVIVNSFCNLIANFTYTLGPNGVVNFNSTSVGTNSALTGYTWTANTFTMVSGLNISQPAYTFTSNGTYFVILTIRNSNNLLCDDSASAVINITSVTLTPCNLNANFNYNQGSNGLVNFNNTTTGTVPGTTYFWSFGDNTTGNAASPAHTYSANGTYIATLTANNNFTPSCTSSKTLAIIVNSYCNLIANFGYTLGANGLVNFKSTSTGTTAFSQYSWNFGNGSGSGIAPNRVYANGTYTVILTVTNLSVSPTCSNSISQTITVTSFSCPLLASFAHTVGAAGLVNFESISTNTTASSTYTWNFGDGFISNLINPSHVYSNAGAYLVSLNVADAFNNITCSDTTLQVLNVTGVPCVANSNFTLFPTNTPKFWNAVPAYPWNVAAARWSWGDGTTTDSLYCSHVYSVSATYTICLSVTVSCGASSSVCSSYFINKSSSGNSMDMLYVNVLKPEAVLGIENTVNTEPTYFNIYPNPNEGKFNVKMIGLKAGKVNVDVYDMIGKQIYSATHEAVNGKLEEMIKMDNATKGIYILKITHEGYTTSKRMIVKVQD